MPQKMHLDRTWLYAGHHYGPGVVDEVPDEAVEAILKKNKKMGGDSRLAEPGEEAPSGELPATGPVRTTNDTTELDEIGAGDEGHPRDVKGKPGLKTQHVPSVDTKAAEAAQAAETGNEGSDGSEGTDEHEEVAEETGTRRVVRRAKK